MHKSIFKKLLISFIINSLLITGVFLFLSARYIKTNNERIFAEDLSVSAKIISGYIKDLYAKGEYKQIDDFAKAALKDTGRRITVINGDGAVIADSSANPSDMDNHANREEIENILSGKSRAVIRYSATLRQHMLYVAALLPAGGGAVLRISVPVKTISIFSSVFLIDNMTAAAAIFAFSLLLAYFAAAGISLRIKQLKNAFEGLLRGDFKIRTDIVSGDELQDLSETFNKMSAGMEEAFDSLRESRNELDRVISSVSDAIIVINAAGTILLANRAFAERFAGGAAAKKYYWEILGRGVFDEYLKEGAKDISLPLEFGGRYFICHLSQVDNTDKFVIVMHDITEIKNLETVKKDLISNVSHELKTPLSSFKAYLEFLEDAPQSERAEYLAALKRGSERLNNIVNDLLILSDIEHAERFDYETFRAEELFSEMKILFANKAAAKNLKLIFNPPRDLEIYADKFRLGQALSNLIENAVKYSEKGEIQVAARQNGAQTEISVKDAGLGIAAQDLRRIFERFYVADKSRSKKTGGTGLGLSIAKHIAEKHGGLITVESELGKGSVFTIKIPGGSVVK
ncbi:MAG: cell wall metabolism sensor histidine kinase WalK [Elusimicrobiota bacterium]|jgi:two-component system phosphate regulon sensor histidine kinase PhoR|nr:cell wall metabolism sensor histidine kinase WalK [Elusimicrobiota bacterium]